MPRYHFNVFDGQARPDLVGTELPDLLSVRIETLRRARDVIRDAAIRADFGEEWRIEVTDDAGLILFTMEFLVPEQPSTTMHALPH